jgi:hypothetical protein
MGTHCNEGKIEPIDFADFPFFYRPRSPVCT